MKLKLNKNELTKLLFLSFLFVLPKWLISYYFFNEEISLRIINEIEGDGEFYLSNIKSLAELNFTNIYSFDDQNVGYLPIPIGSLFINSFFYFLIGNYSIILVELIYVFFFIYFFSLIQKIYFEQKSIIYISFLILLIPTFITAFNLDQIQYLNIISTNFFSLRLHRPMGTTIFLIIFIYILITIFEGNLKRHNSFFLGLTLGLTFASYYYFFIIQIISFFILIIIKFKLNIYNFFKSNILNIVIITLGFSIFAAPFILNLMFAETDFTERAGAIVISNEKKIIILKYYLELLFSLKFLILILINSALLLLFLKLKIKNTLLYKIPFIIFISSIISPFLFFLISTKASLIYHFNNNIIICSFISIIFFIISFYFNYLSNKKFFRLNYFFYIVIVLSVFYISNTHFQKNKDIKNQRVELSEVTKILNDENLSKLSILTFENKIMIWSIINDIKDLKIINGLLVPKKNNMIEKDIIVAFHFLNLDKDVFSKFIENKNQKWRYFNRNISNFFYARYQANKFKTYKNSNNFTDLEIEKILKSSPALNQQLIIPLDELNRLKKKYEDNTEQYNIIPDYIILNKTKFIYNNLKKYPDKYCEIYNKTFYLVLTLNDCK